MIPNSTGTGTSPGYAAHLGVDAIRHSMEKLESSRVALQEQNGTACISPSVIQLRPCRTLEETLGYRCQCSFQIVHDEFKGAEGDRYVRYQYAMRSGGCVIPLGSSGFPIANKSIQVAMRNFLATLNDSSAHIYDLVRRNLASCTFVSSWNKKHIVLTLNYSQNISDAGLENLLDTIAQKCGLKYIIARSKGVKLINNDCIGLEDKLFISDRITIQGKEILYRKPIGAFQHPNPHVMLKALNWMLSCFQNIRHEYDESRKNNLKLLEMYCGCGAHTMALGKVGIFQRIVAVEIDQRLVDSCIKNCSINELESVIDVVKGDAGEFSRRALKQISTSNNLSTALSTWWEDSFDVLLVDPPRYVMNYLNL